MRFDRELYFDHVRPTLFGGSLSQDQVDGQNAILSGWETSPPCDDLAHLAYALATTYHETSKTMQPIEEYGKGAGMSYGVRDPETGQTYYGRGFVQLTWRDNYDRATRELGLSGDDDLVWHAARALDLTIATAILFRGMSEGWFRPPNTLAKFFNTTTDDPIGAREIINGDKNKIPDWSGGVSIGELIAEYHGHFLDALVASVVRVIPVPPVPVARIDIRITANVPVEVMVEQIETGNGGAVIWSRQVHGPTTLEPPATAARKPVQRGPRRPVI